MPAPNTLTAGDTLNFVTTVADYPASAGWTLTHRLVGRTSTAVITLTSVPDTDNHRTTKSAAETAAWVPDTYDWTAWVSKGAERYSTESGALVIAPDPATTLPGQQPTAAPGTLAYAREMHAAALAAERKALEAQQWKTGGELINDEVRRADLDAIAARVRYWAAEVQRLGAAASGRRSGPLGRLSVGVLQ